jgi:tripartite-type tricarboxylate transporter receptor subunit TctC
MLNTVEEIKKLDEANLKEAAKKVKEERDNDEVKAAREKLSYLLDCESKFKASKESIDKQLAEVQELIKAFGYPPPTSTK